MGRTLKKALGSFSLPQSHGPREACSTFRPPLKGKCDFFSDAPDQSLAGNVACPLTYPALLLSGQESDFSLLCLPNSSEALQGDLVRLLLLGQRHSGGPHVIQRWWQLCLKPFSLLSGTFTYSIWDRYHYAYRDQSLRNQSRTLTLAVSILVWHFGMLYMFILVFPLKYQ